MKITSNSTIAIDWLTMLSSGETRHKVHAITGSKAGIVILKPDGQASFVTEADLSEAASSHESEDAKLFSECFQRAKNAGEYGYDKVRDVVVAFEEDSGPIMKLVSTKKSAAAKALLIRPVTRTTKIVNLGEDQKLINHLLFEVQS